MSEVKWTADQHRAIDTRGSSVLVSAAAGSGKTAVLVERLLRRIVDERLDVTQFLIITYTKAAASELRRKIGDALAKLVAEHPEDKHLRRQVTLVGNARISTVHAFCSWLLKNYGNISELAGGFRIFDETEGKILIDEVLRELIEDKYEEAEPDFLKLASYMSDDRNDKGLSNAVLELYNKSMSHPYPEKWLAKVGSSYELGGACDISETVWGAEAMKRAKENLSLAVKIFSAMLDDVDRNAETSALYHDRLTEALHDVKKIDSSGWDRLRESAQNITFKSLPSSKKLEDKSIAERIKHYNSIAKSCVTDISKSLLIADSQEVLSEIKYLSEYVGTLTRLTLELCERYSKEKLRRGALEYSDLEHYAINLLIEDYDEENDIVIPSETGLEVSESFAEILLDEFQDSNIIQDVIFRAVSRDEKNIVMVGDVKQSIYGFRLADPSIFMKKYKTFKKYDEAKEDEPRCITLSQNFRSRDEVIDASNGIFSRIMTEDFGGVDYTDDQRLVVRNDVKGRGREDLKCEFCLIDRDKDDEEKGIEQEARFVAAKIRELVDSGFIIYDKDGSERPVSYRDIAILFRSASKCSPVYEHAFEESGIPYVSPNATGLLGKSEINAVISYLSVIDNPTSEIPLLAALRSPLFGFSADDLCFIRREREGNLFYALEHLANREGETAKKCRAFLSELSYMRAISRGMSVGALIWEVYNRTNALGIFGALSCGEERQQNLIALYDAAQSFENTGYFGLYKFLSQIAALSERGGDIAAPLTHASDAVRIMTMHKSKGLEFPVVFIGNAIRKFNKTDITKKVLIHPKLGIGLKMRNDELSYEHDTLMQSIIRNRITDEQKSEEMRLFYVALTRAREKLFIVASLENAETAITSVANETMYGELARLALKSGTGAQNWFLLPLIKTRAGKELLRYAGLESDEEDELPGLVAYVKTAEDIPLSECGEEEKTVDDDAAELSTLEEMLSYEYPYTAASMTQSKLTATGLSAVKNDERTARRRRAERPRFMREKSLTAAERGTALHMAMQFAHFDECLTLDGAKLELSRLVDEKYLTEKQFESISPEKIFAFVRSDIGREMLASKNVRREFKFSVLLPANEALGIGELRGDDVLLQGVIDMYYETDDGITIVDFKTDRRRPEGDVLAKYTEQLRAYRRALREITGKDAKRLILYLVSLGEYIEI